MLPTHDPPIYHFDPPHARSICIRAFQPTDCPSHPQPTCFRPPMHISATPHACSMPTRLPHLLYIPENMCTSHCTCGSFSFYLTCLVIFILFIENIQICWHVRMQRMHENRACIAYERAGAFVRSQ